MEAYFNSSEKSTVLTFGASDLLFVLLRGMNLLGRSFCELSFRCLRNSLLFSNHSLLVRAPLEVASLSWRPQIASEGGACPPTVVCVELLSVGLKQQPLLIPQASLKFDRGRSEGRTVTDISTLTGYTLRGLKETKVGLGECFYCCLDVQTHMYKSKHAITKYTIGNILM